MEKYLLNIIGFMLSPFTENFFKEFENNRLVNKTVNLYPNKEFVKIRFWDAPFIEVEKIIPGTGRILDLGCGEGIFTNYLALSSTKRKIIGLELDKDRLKQADRGIPNVIFRQANAARDEIPQSDCIILFHLLHHLLSFSEQEKVIHKSIKGLSENGKIIIVEVEPKISFKYFLAYLTDHFIVPWLFEKRIYSSIFFRRSKKWKKMLEHLGLVCEVYDLSKNKPFSHVVLVGRKNN